MIIAIGADGYIFPVMKRRSITLFAVLLALVPAGMATGQATVATDGTQPALIREAADLTLDQFQWTARPIVVFADTPADPRFHEQINMLKAGMGDLVARDVVVLTDTDPTAASPIRQKLRPRGFQVVLVGKDGDVKLRKPLPYSVREITRTIDKMPLRQQEVRERRDTLTE